MKLAMLSAVTMRRGPEAFFTDYITTNFEACKDWSSNARTRKCDLES